MDGLIQMSIKSGCAIPYSGARWLTGSSYIFVCGKLFCIQQAENGEQDFFISKGRGIGCIAVHRETGLIAHAEKGLHPRLFIYAAEGFKQLSVITEGPEIQYTSVVFSPNGDMLAACEDSPDLKMVLWDWQQGIKLVAEKIDAPVENISFSCTASGLVSIISRTELQIWSIGKYDEEYVLKKEILACENVVCSVWGQQGLYYGCCDGSVALIACTACQSQQERSQVSNKKFPIVTATHVPVSAMCIYGQDLVVAHIDGRIKAYNIEREYTISWEKSLNYTAIKYVDWGSSTHQPLLVTTRSNIIQISFEATKHAVGISVCSEAHDGAVTGCCCIQNNGHISTAGVDGTFRIWDLNPCRHISKLTHCGLSTAFTTSCSACLAALGSSTGVIRLIATDNIAAPKLIFRMRVFRDPISCIVFNKSGLLLACMDNSKRVCFLRCSDEEVVFQDYVDANEAVLSLSWVDVLSQSYLIMSTVSGSLSIMGARTCERTAQAKHPLPIMKESLQQLNIEFPLLNISSVEDDQKIIVYGSGADKTIARYEFPSDIRKWNHMKGRTHRPVAKYDCHQKACAKIDTCSLFQRGASGSADGSITIWREDLSEAARINVHDSWVGGATGICFDHTGHLVVSVGADGALIICSVLDPKIREEKDTKILPNHHQKTYSPGTNCEMQDSAEEFLWSEERLSEKQSPSSSPPDPKYFLDHPLYQKFLTLQQTFNRCVIANSRAPESERLGPFDFVIDHQLEAELKEEGDKRVRKVKEEAAKDIQTNSIIWERIKEQCWDTMEVKDAVLKGLKSGLEVHNFPIAQVPYLNEVLPKLILLRKVEMKENAALQIPSLGGLLRLNGIEPDDADQVEIATDDKCDQTPLEQVMYDNIDLTTHRRKLSQLHFLRGRIIEIKQSFNKKFQSMVTRKISDIDKIGELNSRLKDVAHDLGNLGSTDGGASPFCPPVEDLEDPESILVVLEDEILVKKYLSPEEQAIADVWNLQQCSAFQ